VTPAGARIVRWLPSVVAIALVCVGFFVHGLHEWVRVVMFVAIVGVAAWGNGAQTQVKVREPAPAPVTNATPIDPHVSIEQKLAD
jgi:hypothetical protein